MKIFDRSGSRPHAIYWATNESVCFRNSAGTYGSVMAWRSMIGKRQTALSCMAAQFLMAPRELPSVISPDGFAPVRIRGRSLRSAIVRKENRREKKSRLLKCREMHVRSFKKGWCRGGDLNPYAREGTRT